MHETLQSLQRQVVRQERLAAVGVLVSGVAHELNNPLQAILGTAELLERQPELSPEALEEIAFLKTQSGRAREIIRNLSRFSSQQSGPPTLVDLRDVIAEVVQLRRRDLDSSAIALDVGDDLRAEGLRELHRARAGHAELRHQRAAGDRSRRERKRGRILIRVVRCRAEGPARGARQRAGRRRRRTSRSCSSRSSRPSRSARAPGLGLSVSYGIIESYGGTIGYTRQRVGRRDLLLRAARRRAGRSRRRTSPMTDRLYYTDPYLAARSTRRSSTSSTSSATAASPSGSIAPRSIPPRAASRSTPALTRRRVLRSSTSSTRRRRRSCTSSSSADCRQPGGVSPVHGEIDWPRRFDHMQQHTGQHVLSAAFDRLFDVRTVSFHLGADSCTIDLAREMSPGEIAAAEAEANRVVWEDRPVAIRFVTAEEAAALAAPQGAGARRHAAADRRRRLRSVGVRRHARRREPAPSASSP